VTSPDRQVYTFAAQDDISAALGKMAGVAEVAEKAFDELGDEAREAAAKMTLAEKASVKVSHELAQQKRKVLELSVAYALLGDNLDKAQVKELKVARARESQLARALKLLTPAAPPVRPPGPGGGGGLFSQALGSPLLAGGIAVGVAASPAIGAAVSAAVLAGIGSAGLGLGIASAIRKDKSAQAEFEQLGADFVEVFDNMGGRFAAPVRQAGALFRRELKDIRTEWTDAVAGMADLVEPLSRGLTGFMSTVTPGFVRAMESARPVIAALAEELPGLGTDISHMLESFGASGGAVEGMRFLVNVTGDLAVATGETVEFLTRVFDILTDLASMATPEIMIAFGPLVGLLREVDSGGPSIKAVASAVDELGGAAEAATKPLADLDKELEFLVDTGQNLRLSTIGIKDALFELSEAADEHGTSLDINTQKGRDNLKVIEAAIMAADRAGDAATDRALAEGKSADAAAAAGAKVRLHWIVELERSARAAGYSASQIAAMVGEAKKADGTTIRTFYEHIHSTQFRSFTNRSEAMAVQLGRRAEGGPVRPGEAYIVGESGPEVLQMGRDAGYVHPNRGGSGPALPAELLVRVQVEYPDGQVAAEQIQRYALRTGQRSVSQVLGLQAA
jgi:hypothetical protein